MLCNSCIHKNVCKHTDHFKEYEKQYEEMRKKSSLFDKPIECPSYKKEVSFNNNVGNLEIIKNFLIRYSIDNLYVMDDYEKIYFDTIDKLLEETVESLKIN